MLNSSTSLFGIHGQALRVWNRRMQALASNLANADTPNYKARDIDFRQALSASNMQTVSLATTEPGHIAGHPADPRLGRLMYRIPMQPSQDGNTVETDVAQAEFANNTVHYRASLAFINNKIQQLRLAIGGR